MHRVPLLVVLVTIAIGVAQPASADLTAFIGTMQSPSSRKAGGVSLGLSLALVGFEFEYSNSSEDARREAPSLQSGMFNLLLQAPVAMSRLRFYGTVGGGFYRERLVNHQNSGIGRNMGAGVKISLAGPIRIRFDYRVFKLGNSSHDNAAKRMYAGINVAF